VKVVLGGIDPGIVDTGLVIIELDNKFETVSYRYKLWTEVTEIVHHSMIVDPKFLSQLGTTVKAATKKGVGYKTLVAVEGYRNRGKNPVQDQRMSDLVQTIRRAVKGSQIVDNTGVKNVVKPRVMGMFGFEFPRTNHQDLESAARIALKLGYQDDDANTVISDFVLAEISGSPWTRT
jgi:hypothetical protein